MKTQYYTATSLDGFIADEHNSLDWLYKCGDGPPGEYEQFIDGVGALAMGSTTYEWILQHTILPGADHPTPWSYTQPAWVFTSRTLPKVPGADIRFVSGDVRAVHAEMVAAANGRNVWLVGGGELVGKFHDVGLLDEIIVGIASATLGGGAPLLPRRIEFPQMKLTSARAFGGGFAELRYDVTAKP